MHRIINKDNVGEAVFAAYQDYVEYFPTSSDDNRLLCKTLFIRGDPTMSLYDLEPQPDARFNPKGELDLGYKSQGQIVIKNVGGKPLKWKISSKLDWISFETEKGEILPDKEIIINVKVVSESFLRLQTIPKPRKGIIEIDTNDPSHGRTRIIIRARVISGSNLLQKNIIYDMISIY